jgi:CRISPR-associated Cas5-like protein
VGNLRVSPRRHAEPVAEDCLGSPEPRGRASRAAEEAPSGDMRRVLGSLSADLSRPSAGVSDQPRRVPLRGVRSKRTRRQPRAHTPSMGCSLDWPRAPSGIPCRGRCGGSVSGLSRRSWRPPPRGRLESPERRTERLRPVESGGHSPPSRDPARAWLPPARSSVGGGSKSTVTVVSARVAAVPASVRRGYTDVSRSSGNVPARGAVSGALTAVCWPARPSTPR